VTSRVEVLERLRSVMVELFDVAPEAVQLDAHLIEDLQLDSIDAIDMAVRLQEMTGRQVLEEELRKVRTVADVVDFVCRHLDASAEPSRPG
jgi:acyl carrier protein